MTTDASTTLPEAASDYLFDLDGIDLSGRIQSRDDIAVVNPHRGDLALLDGIVWSTDDYARAIGVKQVRDDEFWVDGHFPGRPMLPGVLMVEAGAQLCCWQFNKRLGGQFLSAFLRIEDCAFRSSVVPGDELLILAKEIKRGRRRFISDVQGLVRGQTAFEAKLSGMTLGNIKYAS